MRVPGKQALVFMGMIAVGKSYLATALAKQLGCPYYNSDIVRKELAGGKGNFSKLSTFTEGIYSREFSRKTYGEILARAESDMRNEECRYVILDASYQLQEERERVRDCLGHSGELLFVHCLASEKITRERMEARLKDPMAVSDGRWEVYLEQKKRFEYPVELGEDQLLTLDTQKPLSELLGVLYKRMGMHGK